MTTIDYIPGAIVEVEESDLERDVSDGRTKPRYPMDPDELQRTYEKVRAYRAEKRAAKEAKERDKADAVVHVDVVEFAHELDDVAAADGAVGTLARRLLGHGWEVEISRSVVDVPAVLFVGDSDEGDADPHVAGDVRYEAHRLETLVLQAVKRAGGHMLAVQAGWERKHREGQKPTSEFTGAHTYDPILGREWRTTQKGPRKLRDWEKKAGIAAGPPGLLEWLDMIAPKPPKPTPKNKSTQQKETP